MNAPDDAYRAAFRAQARALARITGGRITEEGAYRVLCLDVLLKRLDAAGAPPDEHG